MECAYILLLTWGFFFKTLVT